MIIIQLTILKACSRQSVNDSYGRGEDISEGYPERRYLAEPRR